MTDSPRLPLPPFSKQDAITKVRMAENGWNSKDAQKVAMAYSINSEWRNRSEFLKGREEIVDFLTEKWATENGYKLIKELWAYNDNVIAVRFAYEWHDENNNWFRSYGNENWEFDDLGYMQKRFASINDVAIKESERKLKWDGDIRPDDYPSLTDLNL